MRICVLQIQSQIQSDPVTDPVIDPVTDPIRSSQIQSVRQPVSQPADVYISRGSSQQPRQRQQAQISGACFPQSPSRPNLWQPEIPCGTSPPWDPLVGQTATGVAAANTTCIFLTTWSGPSAMDVWTAGATACAPLGNLIAANERLAVCSRRYHLLQPTSSHSFCTTSGNLRQQNNARLLPETLSGRRPPRIRSAELVGGSPIARRFGRKMDRHGQDVHACIYIYIWYERMYV